MNKATWHTLFFMSKRENKNTAPAIKAMMNRVTRTPQAAERIQEDRPTDRMMAVRKRLPTQTGFSSCSSQIFGPAESGFIRLNQAASGKTM